MTGSSSTNMPSLAAYQAALLDILHEGTDGVAMIEEIVDAAGPMADALGPLDPTLVEVAADLTRTWGRLAEPPESGTANDVESDSADGN